MSGLEGQREVRVQPEGRCRDGKITGDVDRAVKPSDGGRGQSLEWAGRSRQTLTPLRMPTKRRRRGELRPNEDVGRWGALWPLFEGLCSVSAVSQGLFLLTCMRFGKQATRSMQPQGDAGGRGRNTQCALRVPEGGDGIALTGAVRSHCRGGALPRFLRARTVSRRVQGGGCGAPDQGTL